MACYLQFSRRILLDVLSKHPDAAIRVPDVDTIITYQYAIRLRGFPYPSTFLLYKSSYSVGERAGTDLYTSQKIVSLKFM
jgi:hypothetical protein